MRRVRYLSDWTPTWVQATLVCAILYTVSGSIALADAPTAATQVRDRLRPFNVRDSIELPRIANLLDYGARTGTGAALFSSDRLQFLIMTRRGDLRKDAIVESLVLYSTRQVEEYLRLKNSGVAPQPRILLTRDIRAESAEISNVQWASRREVGFIAEGDNGQNQVLIVNTETGQLSQITHSESHVASFAVSGDRIAYYARS